MHFLLRRLPIAVFLLVLLAHSGCGQPNSHPAIPVEGTNKAEFFDNHVESNTAETSISSCSFLDDGIFFAIGGDANVANNSDLSGLDWNSIKRLFEKQVGSAVDSSSIDRVWYLMDQSVTEKILSGMEQSNAWDFLAVVLECSKPIDVNAFPNGAKRLEDANLDSGAGQMYSLVTNGVVAGIANESTLILGEQKIVKRLLTSSRTGELGSRLLTEFNDHSLVAGLDMKGIRPQLQSMIQMAKSFGADSTLDQVAKVSQVAAVADLDGGDLVSVSINIDEQEAADKIAQLLHTALVESNAGGNSAFSLMGQSNGGGNQLKEFEPTIDEPLKNFTNEIKERNLLSISKDDLEIQIKLKQANSFGPLLAALVNDTQMQMQFSTRAANMQKVADALKKYYERTGNLDFLVGTEDEAFPFNWRVAILPELGYQELFDQFHQDEAWDSEANLAVAAQIPLEYQAWNVSENEMTVLRIVNNDKGFFGVANPKRELDSIKDPRNRTALITEVKSASATRWTAPEATIDVADCKSDDGEGTPIYIVDGEFRAKLIRCQDSVIEAFWTIEGDESISRSDFKVVRSPLPDN
ncbi:MAG: hypothetical protein R3C03_12235 [Pirellulaceae bacterium]